MLGTSVRLLELLAVLQGRRFWAGPELSERLGVSARTLRRDVDRLRELGYDIDATSGPGGGYRLGTGTVLPPVLLSEDEAVTLTVALRTMVEGTDPAGERILGVLVKLDQLLPERLRSRVGALHSQTVVLGSAPNRIDATLLSRLAAACRDSEAVRLRYQARGREGADRTVHPLRLVHTGNRRWYLVAWDVDRADWRTFRVDRVERIVSTGPRVVRPEPPADLERYVSESIAHAPYPFRATLELQGPIGEVRAKVPPWIGVLTDSGPDRCRLEIGAPSWEAVVQYAILTGVEFRVIDPPALVHAVAEIAARLDRVGLSEPAATEEP